MTEPSLVPQSACVGCANRTRRDFVWQSLLALLASTGVAACGDGEIGGPTGPVGAQLPGDGLLITIADFPALADVGGIARVDGNSALPIAVTRIGTSSFLAHSMICPHAAYRPITITSFGFQCPNHGAQFAPDGAWTGGQRTSALVRYAATFDPGAGTLHIR